jgi:hypothetical protein
MVHELTHLLVGEIILPHTPGDGGVPRWVHEGIASYMAGVWSDDHERLMRGSVAAGKIPALSQLMGNGGFANPRLNEALGHVAFNYIESRWGPTSIRRFINALIIRAWTRATTHRVRTDASGIRRGIPAIRRTTIRVNHSLTPPRLQKRGNLAQPAGQWVPIGERLPHQVGSP